MGVFLSGVDELPASSEESRVRQAQRRRTEGGRDGNLVRAWDWCVGAALDAPYELKFHGRVPFRRRRSGPLRPKRVGCVKRSADAPKAAETEFGRAWDWCVGAALDAPYELKFHG